MAEAVDGASLGISVVDSSRHNNTGTFVAQVNIVTVDYKYLCHSRSCVRATSFAGDAGVRPLVAGADLLGDGGSGSMRTLRRDAVSVIRTFVLTESLPLFPIVFSISGRNWGHALSNRNSMDHL